MEVNTVFYEDTDCLELYDEQDDTNKTTVKRTISRGKKEPKEEIIEESYDDLEEPLNEDFIEDIKKSVEEHNSKYDKEELIEELKGDENKAKAFITNCKDYLTSKDFNQKCFQLSKLYHVEEKKIAETFAQRVLGTIGDVLGIAIKVTYNACKFLVNLLSKILFATCGVIFSVISKLTSFFTFGYTCSV